MAFFSTNSMEKKFHNSTRGGAKKEPKEGRSTLSKQSRTLPKAATWPWCRRPKRPRLRRVGVASFADKQKLQSKNARGFFESFDKNTKRRFDNDPSAGSPTETLLRLLLPLNAQVWESSRMPRRPKPPKLQSKYLTKTFNR